jgi:RNA polymerase sigma factor (sigma-70 family)
MAHVRFWDATGDLVVPMDRSIDWGRAATASRVCLGHRSTGRRTFCVEQGSILVQRALSIRWTIALFRPEEVFVFLQIFSRSRTFISCVAAIMTSIYLIRDQALPDTTSDGILIRRFAEERDHGAFATLLQRHGGLVWSVGMRLLKNREEVEDAFQATFLVLAKRAGALAREKSLAAWLHGVAVRVCRNQLRIERRHQRRLSVAVNMARGEYDSRRNNELRLVVDEALAEIPQRYREVLVMCDMEGFTIDEVARRLSVPRGTISSRLTRGRERLRKRLVHQGLVVAAGMSVLAAAHADAAVTLPESLLESTVLQADAFAWGTATAKAGLSLHVSQLANGALRAMMFSQWKNVACIALLTGIAMFGGFSIFGNSNAAFAGTRFTDVFNDGDIGDGSPATWTPILDGWPATDYQVVGEDLRLFSTSPGESAFLGALDIMERDLSIRAQVRIDSDVNESAAIYVRGAGAGNPAAYLEIDAAGRLWYFNDEGVYGQYMETDFRPGVDDVILQVDAFDDTETYWVWRAGDPKPKVPTLQRTSSITGIGIPGFAYGTDPDVPAAANRGAAVFRYVSVADTPIVPEPGAGTLCAIGGGLVGLGLCVGRRLKRGATSL